MPLSTADRKAELVRRDYNAARLAAEVGTSTTLAGKVIAGESLRGPKAELLMERIAAIIGHPVEIVFPVKRHLHYEPINGRKKVAS